MDCQDYHCECSDYREQHIALLAAGLVAEGYCRDCGCDQKDHGKGFRALEQISADEARAKVTGEWGELYDV